MEIKETYTQKALCPTQIKLGDYVINPYKGCEFGCLYCYVQQNKNIKNQNTSWGEFVEAKINLPQVLEKELLTKKPERVLMGSTTECCQYIDKKYRLTEKILRILNKKNIAYTILTKSHLVANYLAIISDNKNNKIYFTFNVSDQKYIDLLEKKSSSLEQRLTAIKKIVRANIGLRIHIGPFLPYISSLKRILEILPRSIVEFDVELYHNKMGNFKEILSKLRNESGDETADKIKKVYSQEKEYLRFSEGIKNKIKEIGKKTNRRFYFILPDYNKFYQSNIDYYRPAV